MDQILGNAHRRRGDFPLVTLDVGRGETGELNHLLVEIDEREHLGPIDRGDPGIRGIEAALVGAILEIAELVEELQRSFDPSEGDVRPEVFRDPLRIILGFR